MTITYRTAGDWGAGKGANLTPAEVDENFYSIEVRLEAVENYALTPAEITNVTVVGSQLTFFLSDETTFGPFTLPRARPAATVETLAGPTYTLAAADDGKYLRATDLGGLFVTVPEETPDIPINAEYHFIQAANAGIDFIGSATINYPATRLAATDEQFAVVTLKKVAASEWDLFGLLAEAGTD